MSHPRWKFACLAVVSGALAGGVAPAADLGAPDGSQQGSTGVPHGPQGDTWASITKLPDWSGIWELNWQRRAPSRPAPGAPGAAGSGPAARPMMRPAQPKLLPEAQAKLDAYRKGQAEGKNLQPEAANCFPVGMPQIMTQPYPIEFLFTPGKVTMIIEAYHEWRHVFTDGRKHSDDPDPAFQGESIGHWEGDTLVVDTVGLAPTNQIAGGIGHSDQARIVERIRRTDPEYIEITTTITDPKVLAEPWTQVRTYRKEDGDLREYECEQNNHDSADEEGRPGLRVEDKK